MQINGVGNSHDSNMHQITECMHSYSAQKKSGGAAAASSANNSLQSDIKQYQQQEGQFSLVSWLKDTLSRGRKSLWKIWGESADAVRVNESSGDKASWVPEQEMAQLGDPDEGKNSIGRHVTIAAQETMAGSVIQQQNLQNNPYFSAIEDTGKEKQRLWEKVRVRFYSIASQLTKQFSGRNTFQTKKEQSKEDLRKHSRYREDDLEIDCILTDDSYLLDSYDRKGEYSKLSTKK